VGLHRRVPSHYVIDAQASGFATELDVVNYPLCREQVCG